MFTPWCRVLLEQLTGLQLVKKFPAFHVTRRFITALTSVRHLSLPWASSNQSIYPYATSCRFITQLYDGRDMYIIYYIKHNYMFRHFSLACTHTTHPTQYMRDLVPTSLLTSPSYTTHTSRVQLLTKVFIYQPEDG